MKSQKFEPPICPVCGKPLEAVYENEYWTYSFDEKTGTYKGDIVDIEIRCPDCHASARDQFPEGACNYKTSISFPNIQRR
jgi:hypothetical protein